MKSVQAVGRLIGVLSVLAASLCGSAQAAPAATASVPAVERFELGIDRMRDSGFERFKGLRLGLVTNPSGVDSRGQSTIQLLYRAPGIRLAALFGPEHGVYGDIKAGKEFGSTVDPVTGLKVYSLYGSTRKPTPQMMSGLDAIVYDMQDLGCRSYTFISTLGLVMEAASESGVQVFVLDRPNPLGGMRVEGPRLDPRFRTFVGMYDIPYVYGLTVGELARWINRRHLRKPCNLTIVPMKGWKRNMVWEDTGLKWVPTSPNIPRIESVRGYVATGLLGEIGVANGANDVYPFEIIASEGLPAEDFARRMNGYNFPGVTFEKYGFYPSQGAYQRVYFSGVRLRIDPHAPANLASIPFYAIPVLRERFYKRNYFQNRTKDPVLMFDKINGSDQPRRQLMSGVSASQIVASWSQGVASWLQERREILLYNE